MVEKVEGSEIIKDANCSMRLPMWISKVHEEDFTKSDGTVEKQWIVEGLAAKAGEDRNPYSFQITEEALEKGVKFFGVNNTMFLEHDRHQPIGRVLKAQYEKGVGITIKAFISKTAPNVWTQIEEGVLTGFSIGARVRKFVEKVGKTIEDTKRYVTDMEIMECSVVAIPANVKTRIWDAYVSKSMELTLDGGQEIEEEFVILESDAVEKAIDVPEVITKPEEVIALSEKDKTVTPVAPAAPAPAETVTPAAEATPEPEVVKAATPVAPVATPVTPTPEVVVKAETPATPAPVTTDVTKTVSELVKAELSSLMDSITALQKSIDEMKSTQVTKEIVKEQVKEFLGTIPEEIKKGLALVDKERTEAATPAAELSLDEKMRLLATGIANHGQ